MDRLTIHTPELTTLGASAKGWIREEDGLYLHKIGKYEIPADKILTALGISHISYRVSKEEEISSYLTEERQQWIEGVGEVIVNARLFTSEEKMTGIARNKKNIMMTVKNLVLWQKECRG